MFVEAFVFGGDEGFLHAFRNIGQRHPDAAVVSVEHFGEALALAVENGVSARRPQRLEFGIVRQIDQRLVVEFDHLAEIDRRIRHRLVLAELLVGGEQVIEVEALERLDVAGDGLGIVHRGRDQVVELDVLDIERLAHVGTALTQHLRYRFAVRDRIEMRFDLVGGRRHLAQGQRGREHLDQDRVHVPC